MSASLIPGAALRNQPVYRSYHGRPSPVSGCGFMLKPRTAGGYINRVMRTFVVVYILRGTGVFTDHLQRRRRVAAGDMILLPAGKAHGVQQDPDGQWAEAYFTMDGAFGRNLLRLGVIDPAEPLIHPGLDAGLLQRFERILADLSHLPDAALPCVLASAHELLSTAQQLHRAKLSRSPQDQLIENACLLLSRDLQKRLDMPALAASMGMSYERFRKLFRQRVGLPPGDYRIRRRIDLARALLGQHRLSNKAAAYELGYPDPFTFSRQFHKVTGRWPDEYRRSPAA